MGLVANHFLRGIPIDLGVQCVQQGGQSLVFAETRVRSKSLATKASDVISQLLQKKELTALEKTSKQILFLLFLYIFDLILHDEMQLLFLQE